MVFSLKKKKRELAYLGPNCSFSHIAARNNFGNSVVYKPVKSFDLVIEAAKSGAIGELPFFNPFEHHIRECQEKLFNADLLAIDTYKQRIDLHLASKASDLKRVKKIISNSHVFKQCAAWLKKNLLRVSRECVGSTAEAAKVAQRDVTVAAICSEPALKKYRLRCLADNIHDSGNFTLFFIVQKREFVEKWGTYSFFCFKLKSGEEKDNILDMLKDFNLTSTQQWTCLSPDGDHFLFFLEVQGRYLDLDVVAFETEFKKHDPEAKLIGSFNRSITKVLATI